MTTAENNELWNQVTRVANLVIVVVMLVSWLCRDIVEHKEQNKKLDKVATKQDIEDLKQFIVEKMEHPEKWDKAKEAFQ